jgi:hypothetical protein
MRWCRRGWRLSAPDASFNAWCNSQPDDGALGALLSLLLDHRVVTGGEGRRFLMALKADLECSIAMG